MLLDYINMMGNFEPGYMSTGFYPSGYFDTWAVDTSDFTQVQEGADLVKADRMSYIESTDEDYQEYEILFRPPTGILNCQTPLAPKTELIISFDRADSSLALISKVADQDNPLAGKVIPLENCFLRARYYTTPMLRNFFSKLDEREISYKYDECSVVCKNLPKQSINIILPNIIGGNTPTYIFW